MTEIYDNKNIVVTDDNYNIIYAGSNITKYLNKDNTANIGYKSSIIEKNDIVILIESNYDENVDYNKSLLDCIGIKNELKQASRFIVIGSYCNNEVQPIYKYNFEHLNINTIFCGNELLVELNNKRCTVKVNNIIVECDLIQYSNQLIIFNEDGIKYFRDENKQSRLTKISDILKQIKFNEYIKADYITNKNINLQNLINEDIVKKLIYGGDEYFKFHNTYIWLNKKVIHWKEHKCYIITIEDQQEILESIKLKVKKHDKLEEKNRENKIIYDFTSYKILGHNENMKKVKYLLKKASTTNITIMLLGESGTGKTFMAHEIHKNSKRHNEAFIHVNCASIPYNLIESELFGYSDGAFTGARKGGKKGFFELANNGTIFLDEITEMPIELQGRLLEVIQNKTFYKVGGIEKVNVDVRLIVATNKNLKNLIIENKFREDLYYRINVFPIVLPSLRERMCDFYMIVSTLLPNICNRMEVEPLLLSPDALEKMKLYDWPGNIRELENILEKAVILCEGKFIKPEDIFIDENNNKIENKTLKEMKEEYEKNIIIGTLNKFNGEKVKTAKYLGIGRTSLFEKIKKYNIDLLFGDENDNIKD
jgi:transcriptional regulator with PAS, ATPase and Fis domain